MRRAKLYYLRDLTGKKARIVERIRKKQPDLASLYIDETEEVAEDQIVAAEELATEDEATMQAETSESQTEDTPEAKEEISPEAEDGKSEEADSTKE